MADEQNRDPAETRETSQTSGENEPSANAPEESLRPKRRAWLSPRSIALLVGIPLVLLILLFVAGLVAVRTGYVGRYIEQNFVAQMDKVGVKTEIGEFHQTFAPIGISMRDVKFYDKETSELLAKVDSIKLDATVTDLYAINLRRNIRLDSTEIEGLEAWVKFDEQGRSNFSRLKVPEQEESNLTFSYSSMKFLLKNSLVHYGDLERKLSGEARNVRLFIEPDAGLSKSEGEVENRRFKFDLAATNSLFTVDDKPIEPVDVTVKGVATESYAEIAELNLKTPFTESRLSGKLENWEKLKYKLNVVSTVDLQKTAETFKTEQALRGFGNFDGTVEGEGDKWTATGAIQSDALAADNVRLKGLRVNASVAGQSNVYEANGKAVAEMLNAGDFELNTLQLAGKVMGTGTDFRYLGDLQAAAARIPGGKIANLVLADAVAEYRDSKLTADVGSVSANSLDAFNAKVRNLRASKAKISNANGITNATVANLRAGSVVARGASLTGVNASNVRLKNTGSVTNVEVGSLQAANLDSSGAKVRGLNAANVRVKARGNSLTANAGNVTAANLQAQGATVTNLRAGNVVVENNGNITNVVANSVQVGGVNTDQATLGSLNIAGVRLKIVGSRIEGSSGDINAGNIALNRSQNLPQGGKLENVKLVRPIFVVEPSGRYRASADLSLGGGVLGNINIGAATAQVTATSGQVELKNFNAQILEGNIDGNATITYEGRDASRIAANFENVEISKILALSGGQVVAVAGKTSGTVNLTFPGLNYRVASGTLNADVLAEAGSDERGGRVPVTGKLGLRATNGLFDVETANFKTTQSELNASGRFDLAGSDSNLQIALDSSDAKELQQLISVLNIAPDLDKQLANNKIELAGNFVFNGTLTGNLTNPKVIGRANLGSIMANNRTLGALVTDLAVNGNTIALNNGQLTQPDGGEVKFDLQIPNGDTNNIAVNATLNQVNIGNLLAALPIQDSLPAALKNTDAKASGQVNLTGVPNNLNGTAEINSDGGTIGGERFDSLASKVTFQNSNILIDRLEARAGSGVLNVSGNYDRENARFNLDATGENLPLERLRGFFGENPPNLAGAINFAAHGAGAIAYTKAGELDFSGFNINFNGKGNEIALDNRAIGDVSFTGKTENQQLTANVTATLNGQQQTVLANVNFADPTLPFKAETAFNDTDLTPFAALLPQAETVALGGRATGNATFGGTLRTRNTKGELVFSTENLRGEAAFSQLTVQIQDAVLSIAEPLKVSFSPSAVSIDNAHLIGTGSDLRINGTAVFAGAGQSDLTADGTINLRVLNFISNNQFFGGLADVSVRLFGASGSTRLSGSAVLNNATFTTIISNERTTFTGIKGRILFASNQAQIERLEARLGGGTVIASGGILLENLEVQSYRLDVRGNDVTARLPQDFRTTGDAEIQISGRRSSSGQFLSIISGDIYASRAEYTRDLDLADIVSTRRTSSISTGTGEPSLGIPQLDLRITGRDALIVRNNIADLTGSLDLHVTGDVNEPIITGRITATGGTIVLLNDKRYDITRATIDFPSQLDASPIVNFQGESDIGGYQVFLEAVGAINDPNNLTINVRSNPALPQADVVSLVTTGSLSNSAGGIPTFAQTGLNTAADLVTDALINQPIRKATDRLFGLNRFEINPVLAGQRGINPSARLTVGRQINRNLSVTYSTNLSEDRNQIIALEYRVSNRISFVAQYEQAPLSNVTRRPDNFSFEVRLRKRF
ncbi:MAG: translocation/assembly module TamB domain-containing protein [Pyrinomonadaceae bacterium]